MFINMVLMTNLIIFTSKHIHLFSNDNKFKHVKTNPQDPLFRIHICTRIENNTYIYTFTKIVLCR